MSQTPWIIIAQPPACGTPRDCYRFLCERCGQHYDFRLPAPVDVMVDASKAFGRLHKRCRGSLGPGEWTEFRSPISEDVLEWPVEHLGLSLRARNCLDWIQVKTVGQLVACGESELLRLRYFGKTSLREVKSKLAAVGLRLTNRQEEEKPDGPSPT